MSDVKLTPTAFVVLGLLSFGRELSGYEVRQWSLNAVGPFYPAPAQSQIYSELGRLEEAGYVTSTAIAQQDRPDKISFAITEAGAERLEGWIATGQIPPIAMKHRGLLRVLFGHNATPDVLIPMLEAHHELTLSILDELETSSVAMDGDTSTGYAGVVVDWAIEIYRGDLKGTELALKRLASVHAPG